MGGSPLSERTELADLRRDQIVAQAGRLFGERGTIDVSMDEIASAAGVARSTVYVYFSSRAELLAACIGDMERQMWSKVEEIDAASPISSLALLFEALIETTDQQPAFFRLVLAANGSTGGIGQVVTEQLTGIAGTVSSHIEQLLASGCERGLWQLDDLDRSARLIGQLIYGTLAVRSLGLAVGDVADEVAAMTDLVIHGLAGDSLAQSLQGPSRLHAR